MAGPLQRARCVDSTRSVAVRVVVAVAHRALGHLAPVAAAVLVARTHHAHALAQHVVLAVALAQGCTQRAQAFARRRGGWRCTGLRQRGRCGAARAVMLPRRLVGGGRRLGLRIGARLGGWLWRCVGRLGCGPRSWCRLGWSRSAAHRGRRHGRPSSHGCHRGRRLYRGGGGRSGGQWHRCGAGIGRCRGADLGRRWLHAGRWGRGLGAQQPPGQPGDHGDTPQAERCIFGSRAARFGRCRLWRQRPGRWSRGFGWRSRGRGRLWRSRDHWSDWGGRDLRCFRGRHGCGC